MTQKEKTRRMNDEDLFERCKMAFPREMEDFRREFARASARRDNAKMLRLRDKYCALTLRIEPRCEFR